MLASRVEVDEEARTPHAADLEAADSLRNAEPVIQDVSRPELESLDHIQLPNAVPQLEPDQENLLPNIVPQLEPDQEHSTERAALDRAGGSGPNFDAIDYSFGFRNSRFSRAGPEFGAAWWVSVSLLVVSAAFAAALGTWGMTCWESLADTSCMVMLSVPECKSEEFLTRRTGRELPECQRCSEQEHCAEHAADCAPNTGLQRCMVPTSGYYLVDGRAQPCAAMDGVLGVSHCTRCDNSSLAGCVAGICHAGYHSFVSGDPPSCTLAPPNPCPGRYSEPLTARHSQYQMWQIEAEDVVRSAYRGRRDISPRSPTFAQAFCRPQGPNYYDRTDQATGTGTSCATLIAGGNSNWKCATGFAPTEPADWPAGTMHAAGWCNEACGFNIAMVAVEQCGVNGECCTCCPLDGESEADTTARCREEARKYPPPDNGQSLYFDETGRSRRPMDHCDDLENWVDERGFGCLLQLCENGNADVDLEWTPNPNASPGPYDLQQTSVDQMQLLDSYDLERATLATHFVQFNGHTPRTGPHAGKSALEACCKCGGGKPRVQDEPSRTNSSVPVPDTRPAQIEGVTTGRSVSRHVVVLNTLLWWTLSSFIYGLLSYRTPLETDIFLVFVRPSMQNLFQWMMGVAKRADDAAREKHAFSTLDRLFLFRLCISVAITAWWMAFCWAFAADVAPVWLQYLMLMIYVWQMQFVKQLLQWRCAVNIAYFLMLASPQGQPTDCEPTGFSWPNDRPCPSVLRAIGALAWAAILAPFATALECISFKLKPPTTRSDKSFFLFGAKFSLSHVSMYGWDFYKASIEAANLLNGVHGGDASGRELCHRHCLGHAPTRDPDAAALAKLLLRATDRLHFDFTAASTLSALMCGAVACVSCIQGWFTKSMALEPIDFVTAFVVNVACSGVMTARYEASIHTVLLCFVEEPTFLQFSDYANYREFMGSDSDNAADELAGIDSLPDIVVQVKSLGISSVERKWKDAIAHAKRKHFDPLDRVEQWLRWSALHIDFHQLKKQFETSDEWLAHVEKLDDGFDGYRDKLKTRYSAPDQWQALKHFVNVVDKEMRKEFEENATSTKNELVIVVSCPELGTLDPGGGPEYDQKVMDKVMELQKLGLLKFTFDRAGTSTTVEGDEEKFDEARKLEKAGKKSAAMAEIMSTSWFESYKNSTKKAIQLMIQGFDGVLVIVCIQGGLITQVEAKQMPSIVAEAEADFEKFEVGRKVISRQLHLSYFDFLNQYDCHTADKPHKAGVKDKAKCEGVLSAHWFALYCHDKWLNNEKMILHEKIDRNHVARHFVSQLYKMGCQDAEDVYSLKEDQIRQVLREGGRENSEAAKTWTSHTMSVHDSRKARSIQHEVAAIHLESQSISQKRCYIDNTRKLEDRLRRHTQEQRQQLEHRRELEDAQLTSVLKLPSSVLPTEDAQSIVRRMNAEQHLREEQHAELVAMHKEQMRHKMELIAELQRTVDGIFDRYDTDGNSGLDQQEFRRWVASISGDIDEDDVDELMKQLDRDSDNTISKQEMQKFFKNYCAKHHWEWIDTEDAVVENVLNMQV